MTQPALSEVMKNTTYGRSNSRYQRVKCAKEVWKGAWISYQRTRPNGHGPEGLYCKQHAKAFEEAAE